MKNCILRPVWNRPEMLLFSLEYEVEARKNYKFSSDMFTLFVAEHNTTPEVHAVIKHYPFPYHIIERETPYGLTPNILEGYKVAFQNSDSFVITIEDDVLLHKSYFKWIDSIFNLGDDLPSFSVINTWGPNNGDVDYIKKAHHYGPWAPLVNKDFFERYILPHANVAYYRNRPAKMLELNKNYMKYRESGKYKFKGTEYNEQAGLINRLVDHAMIDEDMYVLTPEVNRTRNIGYFGKNRRGGSIPGKDFAERTANLEKIITDPEEMLRHAGIKKWAEDYALFNPALDEWDGDIKVR
jgi:hypothetical protein